MNTLELLKHTVIRLKYVILVSLSAVFIFLGEYVQHKKYFEDLSLDKILGEVGAALIGALVVAVLFEQDSRENLEGIIRKELSHSVDKMQSLVSLMENDVDKHILIERLFGKNIRQDLLSSAATRVFACPELRTNHNVVCTLDSIDDTGSKLNMFINYKVSTLNNSSKKLPIKFGLEIDSDAIQNDKNIFRYFKVSKKSTDGRVSNLEISSANLIIIDPTPDLASYQFVMQEDIDRFFYEHGDEIIIDFSYNVTRSLRDREDFFVVIPCNSFNITLIHRGLRSNGHEFSANVTCSPLTDLKGDEFEVSTRPDITTAKSENYLLPYQGVTIAWDCKPILV